MDQAFLDVIPAGVYVCGSDGLILRFNQAAVDLWGRAPRVGDTHKCYFGSRLYAIDGSRLLHERTPMERALRSGEPQRNQEVVIERPDGTRVTALANIEPIRAGDGRVFGAIDCFHDITTHARTDIARYQLAAIVESSSDAIVSKNLDGVIMSWNAGAERLFGYTPDEAVGQPVMMLIPTDRHDEEPAILARIRRGERVETYETARQRKDGSLVDVALTVSPVKDSEGRIIGASKIARDITEKKRAEEQRELMMRELSHRSKNLLAMVQGMMQQAARHARDLPSFEEAFAERLKGLTRCHDLLVHSNWNGASLIDLVHAQCGFIDQEGRHTITTDEPEIILTPTAAQTLGLALYELVTNSVKHGALSVPQGQIRIDWSIDESDGPAKLVFSWSEREGPPVTPPQRRGFGSVMVESITPHALGGMASLEFRPEGAAWRLEAPLENLTDAADALTLAG